MSRTARIAAAAALGGLLLVITVVMATIKGPATSDVMVQAGESAADPTQEDIAHCRAATVPDLTCEAGWESRRRHFFGEDVNP